MPRPFILTRRNGDIVVFPSFTTFRSYAENQHSEDLDYREMCAKLATKENFGYTIAEQVMFDIDMSEGETQ